MGDVVEGSLSGLGCMGCAGKPAIKVLNEPPPKAAVASCNYSCHRQKQIDQLGRGG